MQLYFRSVNKLTYTVIKDFFFQDTNVLYYIKKKKKKSKPPTKKPLFSFNLCTVSIVVFSWKNELLDYALLKKSIYTFQKEHFKCYYFLGESFIKLKLKKTGENSSIKVRDIFKMSS